MFAALHRLRGKRILRIGLVSIGVAAIVVYSCYVLIWWPEDLPAAEWYKTRFTVLMALEAAYCVLAVACLVGIPAFLTLILRARRRRRSAPWLARGLLVCLSF